MSAETTPNPASDEQQLLPRRGLRLCGSADRFGVCAWRKRADDLAPRGASLRQRACRAGRLQCRQGGFSTATWSTPRSSPSSWGSPSRPGGWVVPSGRLARLGLRGQAQVLGLIAAIGAGATVYSGFLFYVSKTQIGFVCLVHAAVRSQPGAAGPAAGGRGAPGGRPPQSLLGQTAGHLHRHAAGDRWSTSLPHEPDRERPEGSREDRQRRLG